MQHCIDLTKGFFLDKLRWKTSSGCR